MPARLALTGKAGWAVLGGGVALIAAIAGWGGLTYWQLQRAQDELAECAGDKRTLQNAAQGNATALDQCRLRLDAELESQRLDLAAQAEASRVLEQRIREMAERAAEQRIERARIYDTDECADWARGIVCPAIADSLRRAAGDRGANR